MTRFRAAGHGGRTPASTRSRIAGAAGVFALGGALLLAAAAPAAAVGSAPSVRAAALTDEQRQQSLWYAQAMRFDELQAQGLDGDGITIAVIDYGINLDAPELQGADIEVVSACRQFDVEAPDAKGAPLDAVTDEVEAAYHGTNAVALLVGDGTAADGGPGTRGIVPKAKIAYYGLSMPAGDEAESEGRCAIDLPIADHGMFEYEITDDMTDVEAMDARYREDRSISDSAMAAAQAVIDGADIVSVSLAGETLTSEDHNVFGDDWAVPIALAQREGVPIVAGTLNPGMELTTFTDVGGGVPYSRNGVVSVNALFPDGEPIADVSGSGYSETRREAEGALGLALSAPGSEMLAPGSAEEGWGPTLSHGTSLATPLVAGTIALGMQAHPDASAFQVLQAMIRTTGTGELEEPQWNGGKYGYGVLNPTAAVAVDPTRFPDENPMLLAEPLRQGELLDGGDPCAFDFGLCTEPRAYGPSPEKIDEILAMYDDPYAWKGEADADSGSGAGLPAWALIGGGTLIGLLVVATAIVVPIVVTRSRRKRRLAARAAGAGAAGEGPAGAGPADPDAEAQRLEWERYHRDYAAWEAQQEAARREAERQGGQPGPPPQ